MFHSQLSLLSLDKIREFDFVPACHRIRGSMRNKQEGFDLRLLRRVKSMGSLDHLTRLNVLFNDSIRTKWHRSLRMFPSLIELCITISEDDMCMAYYNNQYLLRLKQLVASKAPVLKLCGVKSSRRTWKKVLKNSFVEKLVVEGPCTMNVVPVMENLKVVRWRLSWIHRLIAAPIGGVSVRTESCIEMGSAVST